MALTQLQDTEQLQKDIQDLTRELENLRKLYEQYFLGLNRQEPIQLRDKVRAMIQKNSGIAIKNASMKFQLQQCIARYNTFTTYWDRILHQMEEGTYQRDVFKTNLHEKERNAPTSEKSMSPKKDADEVYKKLFEEYKTLKKQLKQDVDSLSFEKFQKQLKGKVENLDSKTKQNTLSFKIVQEGKEMKIKLQARKDKLKK